MVTEARPTFLETVYECAKDFQRMRDGHSEAVAETDHPDGQAEGGAKEYAETSATKCQETGEKLAAECAGSETQAKDDIWYTPNEFPAITYEAEEFEVSRHGRVNQ